MFILRRNPDSSAGVDVAIISAAQADQVTDSDMIEGPAVLIAEVLTPHDTEEEVTERVNEYLDCGVPLVWVVSTHARTVTVYRPNAATIALDLRHALDGFPELPGFSCPVADLFA